MAEITKNIKKGFLQGLGLSLGLSIFALGIFLVKGTDPLTATDGETLTATKWNALVDKVNSIETTSTGYDYDSGWFDVGTSAGYGGGIAQSGRNGYIKTHNLNSQKLDIKVLYRINNTDEKIYNVYEYDQYYSSERTCFGPLINYVDSNSVKISVRYSGCSNHYVSPFMLSKTTGQYRLLVKKWNNL